jgi:hypothetical protein
MSSNCDTGQLGLLGCRFKRVHGVVRDHIIARGYGAMLQSKYQVLYSYGGNKKAPLKLHKSANTNFLLARDNQV